MGQEDGDVLGPSHWDLVRYYRRARVTGVDYELADTLLRAARTQFSGVATRVAQRCCESSHVVTLEALPDTMREPGIAMLEQLYSNIFEARLAQRKNARPRHE